MFTTLDLSASAVTLQDIRAAAAAIAGSVVETPCLLALSAITGAECIKFENHQFTALFKERAALNKLLSLTRAERGTVGLSRYC